MNIKKIIGIVAVVALVGGILYFNQPKTNTTEKPVVKIGVTLPLTGPMGYLGKELQEAMNMRLEEVPTSTKYTYQIDFQDDQLQSSKEFSNVMKFINLDKMDVIISGFAGSGKAIADITKENKILHFDSTWSDEVSSRSPYSFVYYTPIEDIVNKWLDLANEKGYKNIAIINNDSHVGGEFAIAQLKKNITRYPHMKIIDIERIPMGASDLRSVIYKMADKKPDVYLCLLLMPSLDKWMAELRAYKNTIPVSGVVVLEETEEPELFNGSWFVGLTRPNQKIVKRFEEKYNHKLGSTYSAFGYGLINRVIEAYENFDTKPTTQQVSEYLSTIKDIDPVVGPVYVDEKGQFHLIPTIFDISEGKIIPVE